MRKTIGCVLVDCCQRHSAKIGPIATRMFSGRPVLEWVVRRATEAQRLERVLIVMPKGDCVDEIADIVPANVSVFASSKQDSLARVCDALAAHPAESVVLIPLASPLVDPTLIDRLIVTVGQSSIDYASYCSHDRDSLLHAKLGLVAEWYRVSALDTANRVIRDQGQRDEFSRYIVSHPEQFSLKLLPLPKELDRHDLRLRLDTPEDWDHAEQIVDALGHDRLDWKNIAKLVDRQPLLRDRMATLNRGESRAKAAPVDGTRRGSTG